MYGDQTEGLIDSLRGLIDARAAARVWESARATRWTRPPVWVHGDMAVDNLLLRKGRLHAVIDFGQLAAGDPACDLTLAWTLLEERSSATFKERLHLDDGTGREHAAGRSGSNSSTSSAPVGTTLPRCSGSVP